MAYDNTNSGVLFRNREKQDGDKRPDYTGKIDVNGTEHRIAGWVRDGAKGKFLSLKVSDPNEKPVADKGRATSQHGGGSVDDDGSIPF